MRYLLVSLTILFATFDKWGVPISLGERTISVSPYKTLLIVTTALTAIWASRSRRQFSDHVDPSMLRIIVAFVILQTLASLAGMALNSGPVTLPSEAYYLLQRSSVLLLPWMAFHAGMSPAGVLSAFLAAVLMHDAFVALQYVSPAGYRAFAAVVADPHRADNGRLWDLDAEWFDFVGLQTTSNFGVFTALFGLLIVSWTTRNFAKGLVKWSLFAMTVAMAFLSPSRSVLIMAIVALAVIAVKQRLAARWQFYAAGLVASFLVVSYVLLAGTPSRNAFYAFVDPERQASNDGHVDVTMRSLTLIQDSPIVGYGARRFTDLLNATAIDFDSAAAETHSFYLTTVLHGGIIALAGYMVLMVAIVRRLWSRGADPTYATLCGLTIGLLTYNLTYDAGALDVFSCFNGVVAYWALTARAGAAAVRHRTVGLGRPTVTPVATVRVPESYGPSGRRLVAGATATRGR